MNLNNKAVVKGLLEQSLKKYACNLNDFEEFLTHQGNTKKAELVKQAIPGLSDILKLVGLIKLPPLVGGALGVGGGYLIGKGYGELTKSQDKEDEQKEMLQKIRNAQKELEALKLQQSSF